MDSVLNNENEQSASYKAPESGVGDNDEDLMDNHQHLLFGGTVAAESRTDSEIISAPARIGGSTQLARDTNQDLNFVSLSTALTASGTTTSDVRPSAPATTYEGNPLPLMAKVGTANSVALQTPTSDYVVPAGRRSGASDKIATRLVEDSTPPPLVSTEIRLSQLPSAIKNEVAQASVNSLFARLGQPVSEGDSTTVTATATARRSASTDAGSPIPGSGGLTYRPLAEAQAPQTGEDLRQVIRPHLTNNGMLGGALRLVEQTLPAVASPTRTVTDTTGNRGPITGNSDLNAPQRTALRTMGELVAEAPMPRAVRPENNGALGNSAGQIIAENGLLTGGRKSTNSDRAIVSAEPLSPSTSIGYPTKTIDTVKLAQTFDPYSQGTPELVSGRAPRSEQLPGVGDTLRNLIVSNSSVVLDRAQPRQTSTNSDGQVIVTGNPLNPIRQTATTVVNTADGIVARVQNTVEQVLPGARRDGQVVAQTEMPTFVMKDGVVHTTIPRQVQGDSTQGAVLPVVQARTTDGVRPVVDAANNIANAVVINPSLATRAGETVQGGNVVGADRSIVRLPDGRIQEVGRLADLTGKPVDLAVKPGDVALKPGDPIGRTCDAHGRGCEPTGRQAESVVRSGESGIRSNDPLARSSDNIVRTADGAIKIGGENPTLNGNNIAKSDAVAKSSDNVVRAADAVRAVETGNKAAELVVKSDAGAKVDAALKVEGAKLNEAPAKVATAADGTIVARAAEVTGKAIEIKGSADLASAQRGLDASARVAADVKTAENYVGSAKISEQIVAARSAEAINNNAQGIAGDRNVRLADAIVKAAEGGKIVEVGNQVKLDGVVRSSDQQLASNAQNGFVQIGNGVIAAAQVNQIAAIQKNDAVRNEVANVANKASEANQNHQNQLIAQNQLVVKNNEQIIAQAVKVACENNAAAQRNPIAEVKVDQVVADILNHVRNTGKEQQAGAKVIASLDQANIAAQQLDPKALLDAAAVRRILDGQGIVLSPQAINQIMEGIRPTGTNAADYALPSIGSLNLSQIISLGERLQEAVAGASNDSSEPQPKPQLQQHRTKYLVKEGDTLESIAQVKLGDARLFPLLITINRALVNYRLEGERKVAFVVANQYLWLPTDHELEIHKRNFFGKQGKDGKEGSFSLGISSKQNTPIIPPVSFDRTREVSAEVRANLQDFRPSTNRGTVISGPASGSNFAPAKKAQSRADNGNMAGNIDKVRHAGGRQSIKLDEIEFASTQVTHRQCYQVREGETLMSIAASLESMGHISMWKLLAKINGFQAREDGAGKPVENLFAGQFIVLPTAEELNEFKLLEKLTSCTQAAVVTANGAAAGAVLNAFSCVLEPKHIAPAPPPALIALTQGVGGLTTVHKLSNFTRLVLNDLPQLENCFSITVEARWNGQWKPMASYECRHGQTTRHLYNKSGEVKSMELDLPPHVIKEMAREDFVRNWNSYVTRFMDDTAERRV